MGLVLLKLARFSNICYKSLYKADSCLVLSVNDVLTVNPDLY